MISIKTVSLNLALISLVSTGLQAYSASLGPADRDFIHKAAQASMTEVRLGKIALKNSGSGQVKSFAEEMVKEHSQANTKLRKVAAAGGMALPTDINLEQQKAVDHMAYRNGAQFDRAYIEQMVKDHKQVVADFKAEKSNDPSLQQWVDSTLPTIEHHLQMAEGLEKGL